MWLRMSFVLSYRAFSGVYKCNQEPVQTIVHSEDSFFSTNSHMSILLLLALPLPTLR